ncbi:hypothetical protein ALC56_00889 [Trachymyrmex septentrionalis]|uniref:Uncharacterized protein n=1 Tax=Trachymyrmex septentrionalis TaxID=34720 RepID=A0A195FWS8_9HYME|nr:hypothetical protein ALC56_00889 [Trachymyrmex septentrionalis]
MPNTEGSGGPSCPSAPSGPRPPPRTRDVRRWIHEYPSACPWKRAAETRPRDRRGTNPGDGERRDAGQCGDVRPASKLGYIRIQARYPSTVRQLQAGGAADHRRCGGVER